MCNEIIKFYCQIILIFIFVNLIVRNRTLNQQHFVQVTVVTCSYTTVQTYLLKRDKVIRFLDNLRNYLEPIYKTLLLFRKPLCSSVLGYIILRDVKMRKNNEWKFNASLIKNCTTRSNIAETDISLMGWVL